MDATLKTSSLLIGSGNRFSSSAEGKAEIVTGYIDPEEEGRNHTPLELFLISLATCSGMTAAAILRKMGKTIGSLQVDTEGVKRETHPKSFERITLTYTLVSPDAEEANLIRAVELAEKGYCPIWAMVKGNVAVDYRVVLRKPE